MSQTISTPPLPMASREPADKLRPADLPLRTQIFRLLTSMRVALVLLLILALLTLAGTLLEQVPSYMKGDAQAEAGWLEAMRPKYGGWTGVFDLLGLFSVFSSFYFVGSMVLLSTSVLACSIRRAPGIWRVATRPRMIMTEKFFERAPHRAKMASQADPDATLAAVRAAFRTHRFRTVTENDGDAVHVCADRYRWAPFGRVIAHVSFVIILIGAVYGAAAGFRNDQLAIPVGTTVDIGFGTGLALKAKSFADTYYISGEPADYSSELVLYKNGTPVKTGTVRVNHPMRYAGVSFYQSFFGAAADVQVKAANGRVLFNKGVPLIYEATSGKDRIGEFSLADRGLKVYIVQPASGKVDPQIGAGQAQVEVYKKGTKAPLGLQVVSQGEPAKIAGLEIKFTRERQYTGLIVARDPGTFLVWIGSTLLVLGMSLVFFFPHGRVRAVIRPAAGGSETRVAAIRRRDTVFETQFQHLVNDIELAVSRARAQP